MNFRRTEYEMNRKMLRAQHAVTKWAFAWAINLMRMILYAINFFLRANMNFVMPATQTKQTSWLTDKLSFSDEKKGKTLNEERKLDF